MESGSKWGAARDLAHSARLRRMRVTVREFADECEDAFAAIGKSMDALMVTLTFRNSFTYDKGAVSEYVHRQRAWLQRRDIPHAYAWVLELQRRGVPHYHVLWFVPAGTKLPMPDTIGERQRRAFWEYGMTRIEKARRGAAYITKYASKGDVLGDNGEIKAIPRGARLFGIGGEPKARRFAYWAALPRYVRDASQPGDVIRRAPGGGFVVIATGVWIPSRWTLEWQALPGQRWRMTLRRKAEPCGSERLAASTPATEASAYSTAVE